jgi:methylthioribose-1-phosphate isomerase
MYIAQPIEWTGKGVVMLDQRRLPAEEISYTYTDYREVAKAIREMVIRGAPAIGVAAAMGVALGVLHSSAKSVEDCRGFILGSGADETPLRGIDLQKFRARQDTGRDG